MLRSVPSSQIHSAAILPQAALRRALLPLAMVVALLAAACSGSVDEISTTSGEATATAAPTTTASTVADVADSGSDEEVAGIFDFEATLLGGDAFDSTDYIGRDVLVWFWAPW